MSDRLIVRLASKGQYTLPNDPALLAEINELDNEIVALLAGTEARLQELLGRMAGRVEARGAVLEDVAKPSDLVLPPTDLTLAEAAQLFQGEGIIPG